MIEHPPAKTSTAATYLRGNQWRFLSYAWPHRRMLLLATLTGVLKFNLPVAFPWILKEVIDNVLAGKGPGSIPQLNALMAFSAALFVLYAIVTYFRTYLADSLSQRITYDVRRDLFRHLQRLSVDFYHSRQTGAVSTRLITDVSTAQRFVGLAGTNVLMELSSLLAITAVVFAMNWQLALVAYSTLPLYVTMHKRLGGRLRNNSRELRKRMETVEGSLHESIAGVAEIKSHTLEEEETRSFARRCSWYLDAALVQVRDHATLLGLTAFLTRVPTIMVLWVGGHFVLQGQLTVGALMAFYAYLEMIYNPLSRLSDLNVQLAGSLAAIDRLFEFFDAKPEVEERSDLPALAVRRGEITMEQVGFGYLPDVPVLKNINLRIAAGQRIALVGPSGAGKSTLVKLMNRMHDPCAGRILIDGQDIRTVQLLSLRSRIGVVQQSPFLFSGTVEENVRMGRPSAAMVDVERACQQANALEFINLLPDGFETEIGERGVRLSGGQKQRIAIARAFLKDAPILILDESTSQLDSRSEQLIHDALERLMQGRTTVIISHRLSTAAKADQIVVVDHGTIVQQGSHHELISQSDGIYAMLHDHHRIVEAIGG